MYNVIVFCHCLLSTQKLPDHDFVVYRGKKIGDAGALIVAKSLQYYTDIQDLE